MDSLITAAARALAAGDPLGALKRVALRDDAPALALRGIAMAQLGDLVRAKALLRSAARAFGPKEAVARARCVVAEAEIALVSRDLGWPAKALDAAQATLEEHGDLANAAHARYLAVRRLLLIGRLDEAERRLAELDPAPFPPALKAAHELVISGIAMRRLRTKTARAALARAERAARDADIPALTAEVESASLVLNTPAARLIRVATSGCSCSRMLKRYWRRRRSSWTRAVMSCVTHARWSRSQGVRCCSRSHARWARRGPQMCRGVRSSRGHSEQSTPMNRIARGCE
jgi:tetratricopeptide (TPR) repeat protein